MVVVAIKGTVRISGVMQALAVMGKRDFRSIFASLRRPLGRDITDHRDAQRGPRGPWPALAAATRARYARQGKRRNRRMLGRLPSARRSVVRSDSLSSISRVKWSWVHQAGGRAGRGSRIPQRQFMWMSNSFLRYAGDRFSVALVRRFLGA